MVSRSKIDLINRARFEAGLATIGSTEEQDEYYYEAVRIQLLNEARFAFAKKKVAISSLAIADDNYFVLPADFVAAIYPTLLDRIGNKAMLSCSNNTDGDTYLTYIWNVTDTQLFEIGFQDALIAGMAMRYAQEKADTQRYSLLAVRYRSILDTYKKSEASNTPLKVFW